MLIKPYAKPLGEEEDNISRSSGVMRQQRNTLYVKPIDGIDQYYGKKVYDVILVSEMIHNTKDPNLVRSGLYDYNSLYSDNPESYKNGQGINYFVKIVHCFNGVIEPSVDPSIYNNTDYIKAMTLYHLASYSVGESEYHILPCTKASFYKSGSKLISTATYTYSYTKSLLEMNKPKVQIKSNADFERVLNKLNECGSYFIITDPRFPEAIPTMSGKTTCNYYKYSGSDIYNKLINLTVKEIDDKTLQREELQKEKYNEQLRKDLMAMDADFVDSVAMRRLSMRMVCRNIAVDYTKISICSMLEEVEIIYDNTDENLIAIKKVQMPFDKVPVIFTVTKLEIVKNEFLKLCENVASKPSYFGSHVRISLYDTQFEIVVKFTNFGISSVIASKNIISETFKLSKSEAINDYISEGIHQGNTQNALIQNNNMVLLSDK